MASVATAAEEEAPVEEEPLVPEAEQFVPDADPAVPDPEPAAAEAAAVVPEEDAAAAAPPAVDDDTSAPQPVPAPAAEPTPVQAAAEEPTAETAFPPVAKAEEPATDEPAPAPSEEPATGEPAAETAYPPVPTPADLPSQPSASSPMPSPAIFARRHGAPARSAFGRVDEDGIVYVKSTDDERAVGSYPGAAPAEALAYFARKYDELRATADLLHQRVTQTDITAKDAEESYAKLVEQAHEPSAVGDLAALEARIAEIGVAVEARRSQESAQRAAAREEGRARREALVAEAEQLASQPEAKIQWKNSGTRMRELLEEWKGHQRSGPRLDRVSETALWQRFSAARNSFDRARRVHFAQLDSQQAEAKLAKERLVTEAERLSASKDWAQTAGAFKKLMDEWRRAGRAGRADDDALWDRFRAAQDAFFTAKDEIVAREEESFRGNLEVKQGLLKEADAILPVQDLEQAKATLRGVQERWERAGKVPRADIERTEKALRRVEQAVRDAEEKRWSSSNPEAAARAQSLVDQLETAVEGLRQELTAAQTSGNERKIAQARSALEAREQWLAQARAGVEEFGS